MHYQQENGSTGARLRLADRSKTNPFPLCSMNQGDWVCSSTLHRKIMLGSLNSSHKTFFFSGEPIFCQTNDLELLKYFALYRKTPSWWFLPNCNKAVFATSNGSITWSVYFWCIFSHPNLPRSCFLTTREGTIGSRDRTIQHQIETPPKIVINHQSKTQIPLQKLYLHGKIKLLR